MFCFKANFYMKQIDNFWDNVWPVQKFRVPWYFILQN